jgi:hypothetical protein
VRGDIFNPVKMGCSGSSNILPPVESPLSGPNSRGIEEWTDESGAYHFRHGGTRCFLGRGTSPTDLPLFTLPPLANKLASFQLAVKLRLEYRSAPLQVDSTVSLQLIKRDGQVFDMNVASLAALYIDLKVNLSLNDVLVNISEAGSRFRLLTKVGGLHSRNRLFKVHVEDFEAVMTGADYLIATTIPLKESVSREGAYKLVSLRPVFWMADSRVRVWTVTPALSRPCTKIEVDLEFSVEMPSRPHLKARALDRGVLELCIVRAGNVVAFAPMLALSRDFLTYERKLLKWTAEVTSAKKSAKDLMVALQPGDCLWIRRKLTGLKGMRFVLRRFRLTLYSAESKLPVCAPAPARVLYGKHVAGGGPLIGADGVVGEVRVGQPRRERRRTIGDDNDDAGGNDDYYCASNNGGDDDGQGFSDGE